MKKILVILAGFMISCGSQATSTESNTESSVETEQVQQQEIQKKVIKKSIEKTEGATLITEYDQQGNITKIKDSYCSNCPSIEFTFKDGKIISAKGGNKGYCEASVNKQNNSAQYCVEGGSAEVEFNKFGYKNKEFNFEDQNCVISNEYNNDGLLVTTISICQEILMGDYEEAEGGKTTTKFTYTYDVMNQDWTKRTRTDNKGNKTVTTRTMEYW
jgi:hypothetical protein